MKLLILSRAIRVRLASAIEATVKTTQTYQSLEYTKAYYRARRHESPTTISFAALPALRLQGVDAEVGGDVKGRINLKKEKRTAASFDARPALGLQEAGSEVAPRLRGHGIGQRWVKAMHLEQSNKKIIVGINGRRGAVLGPTSRVRRSAGGIGFGVTARVGNSWVCPVCRCIIQNKTGTQVVCVVGRCSGVMPGQAPPPSDRDIENENDTSMEKLIAELLQSDASRKDATKTDNTMKDAGGVLLLRWALWLLSVAGGMLALRVCAIWLQQAIAPWRFDTPDAGIPKVDFGTSSDINLTFSAGPYTTFAVGFKIVAEATGEYESHSLPLPDVMSDEIEEKGVEEEEEVEEKGVEEEEEVQEKEVGQEEEEEVEEEDDEPAVVWDSRESVRSRGVDSSGDDKKEGVEQGVVSVFSSQGDDVGVEDSSEGIVVSNTPKVPKMSKMCKRFSGWRERHRGIADDLLNSPWY